MQPKTEGTEEKGPNHIPYINDPDKRPNPRGNDHGSSPAQISDADDATDHDQGDSEDTERGR